MQHASLLNLNLVRRLEKEGGEKFFTLQKKGDQPVMDNEGDPFRFHILVPRSSPAVVQSKIICSSMDSTIDFHCVR